MVCKGPLCDVYIELRAQQVATQAGHQLPCTCACRRPVPPGPRPCLGRSMTTWCGWWMCRASAWSCAGALMCPTPQVRGDRPVSVHAASLSCAQVCPSAHMQRHASTSVCVCMLLWAGLHFWTAACSHFQRIPVDLPSLKRCGMHTILPRAQQALGSGTSPNSGQVKWIGFCNTTCFSFCCQLWHILQPQLYFTTAHKADGQSFEQGKAIPCLSCARASQPI